MPQRAYAERFRDLAPVDAFKRLAPRSGVFWLDSSQQRDGDGRYSIMGCEPTWLFEARADKWEIRRAGISTEHGMHGALEQLDAMLEAHRVRPAETAPTLPFQGGAVGWLAYDLGRQFEQIDGTAIDDLAMPDIYLAWYDRAVVWDHASGAVWLVAAGEQTEAAHALRDLAGWLSEIRESIDAESGPTVRQNGHNESSARDGAAAPAPKIEGSEVETGKACSDFSRAEYLAGVAQIREGIARGEFYQLNLVQRFTCPMTSSASETYLRLRNTNPAPFSAFIAAGENAILSSSPERFIEVTPDGAVRTCPIKGTREKREDAIHDAAMKTELAESPKERAELLMIVDLLRNDLGRVCVPGSVTVDRLYAIESFATVHHLVGEVRGQLRTDVTRPALLRAVFPGGSITGAPKVSAMRAIDRLERHRRGVAMGAIGYFSAHGRIDLSIAIRTIVSRGRTARIAVGAGIVWDSDPAAEYAETLAKAQALFAALGVRPISQ